MPRASYKSERMVVKGYGPPFANQASS